MRFGMSIAVGRLDEGDYTLKRTISERLEMARTAQAAGIEVVSTGQHFGQGMTLLAQPMPLLARIAADVPGMTLQTGVLLAPFYHPVALAEEMATLHAITDGHFQAAIGIGYRESEFDMYGQSRKERLPRTIEIIGIVRALLRGETVTHAGRFFTLDGVSLGNGAVEQPGPRILIGATAAPAVERAGRIADGVYLDGYWLKSDIPGCIDAYRQAVAASGNRSELMMRRELRFGDTRAKALDAGRASWAKVMEDYHGKLLAGPLEWIAAELKSGGYSRELPFIAGTSEECAAELVEYAQMGVETMLLRIQGTELGVVETMQTIERFGAEVLPLVRAAGY
jgi:alkanesulfonate monooxygenase SsuD/methylene tetrahydromethanopterin reductase-like flavin-dependent oxidoreductase (luciferase family)